MWKRMKKTLSGLFLTVVFVLLSGGWTVGADVSIGHDGKGSATLLVESSLSYDEFKAECEDKLYQMNLASTETDCFRLNKLTATAEGYEVKITFRRIDKLGGIGTKGEFSVSAFSSYAEEESEKQKFLTDLAGGKWRYSASLSYRYGQGNVRFERESRTTIVEPTDTQGRSIEIEEFLSRAKKADGAEKLFAFRFADVEYTVGKIVRMTVSLPGEIEYYAGNGIRLTGKNSVELSPTKRTGTASRPNESGELQVYSNEEMDVMFGYVVFRQSKSPIEIFGIVALCVIIVGIVVGIYIAFYRLGRKTVAEEEKNEPKTDTQENEGAGA